MHNDSGFIFRETNKNRTRTNIISAAQYVLARTGVRRVSRRFDIFRSAARPRAAFEYFGLRQFIAALAYFGLRRVPAPLFDFITLSFRFGSAVRLNAVKQVPLWLSATQVA